MQLRKIKFLVIDKELGYGTNVPNILILFKIAIDDKTWQKIIVVHK